MRKMGLLAVTIMVIVFNMPSKLMSQIHYKPPAVNPNPSVPCKGTTSQELTQQGWEALDANIDKSLSCTSKTINRWYGQANEQQTAAISDGCKKPNPQYIRPATEKILCR